MVVRRHKKINVLLSHVDIVRNAQAKASDNTFLVHALIERWSIGV